MHLKLWCINSEVLRCPRTQHYSAPCGGCGGGGLVSVVSLTGRLNPCKPTAEQDTSSAEPGAFILSCVPWTGAKLESAVHCPPAEQQQQQQSQWSGAERQPPPWTDELAEMSRHIYTRHGIGDGLQKPVFQVRKQIAEALFFSWTHTNIPSNMNNNNNIVWTT